MLLLQQNASHRWHVDNGCCWWSMTRDAKSQQRLRCCCFSYLPIRHPGGKHSQVTLRWRWWSATCDHRSWQRSKLWDEVDDDTTIEEDTTAMRHDGHAEDGHPEDGHHLESNGTADVMEHMTPRGRDWVRDCLRKRRIWYLTTRRHEIRKQSKIR